jgi:glycosyltransferase involved in cell wall biosynthesis
MGSNSLNTSVVAAAAPYGIGGSGQVLSAVVEELRAEGELVRYFASRRRPGDPAGTEISLRGMRGLARLPLRARETLSWSMFDDVVARRIAAMDPADAFVGFAGAALRSFRAARRRGFGRLVLESPTSHVEHVRRRHRAATELYPIEPSWLSEWTYRRARREYEEADEIVVCSEYARETFVAGGVPASKLRLRELQPAARFAPAALGSRRDGFSIVYSGRLQVTKGVPVLLDALERLPGADLRVTLVGSTATAAMDRYLQVRGRSDRRVTLAAGDPLPYLHRADVFVHPSFEDGFGFAPAEALAVGVPVIATEDTGMKERIVPGSNGYVVPTGDAQALRDALAEMRAR